MSFYEDNVADGSHCASCCQYIGPDVGYTRFCKGCGGDHAKKPHQLPMKQKKQAKIAKVKAWLAQHGIKHTAHNNDAHFILHPPAGPLIDVWPTTGKWQQRGGKVSTDPVALTELLIPPKPAPEPGGWVMCTDAKPADGQVVVVWRKWPNWNCFAAELDCWQADSSDTEGGAWYEAEESCQRIETCADGPGEVARPITTHWHPLPADPTE